ncbi:adenylyltransferase/cytidyltransferase family protein [Tepidimicrobium xylanilyticum]|uniref:adenylyltransferase/cytidyltransferase family protein n=1 Tax=Tepidimicrobium xylanilyticum TaxID=1123352 RepID=UPI00265097AD|nr:adenylyltransferase/cytidyltransferase family protein [Tepidimicrobium xylanilyticum]GMG95600.1 cytidyltransferase [Tepidimicrobium xylanilyticum]
MIVGYTTGVFDLFHIGHLNMLRNAKSMCDKLIVGVTTDELVSYKNKKPLIPFEERIEIVRSIKFVDVAIPQTSMEKFEAWKRLKFNIMFVGDDWYNTDKWNEYETQLSKVGVKIIYFPYTNGISSTLLSKKIRDAKII